MTRVQLRAFRSERDLLLVSAWVDRPEVARWWGERSQVLCEIGTRTSESASLIVLDGEPVGLLCWQVLSGAERAEAGLGDLPGDLIDVDVMIGDPGARGRGVGPRALRLLLRRLQRRGVRAAGISAELANEPALRAYRKAGFTPFRDFLDRDRTCRYFVRNLVGAAAETTGSTAPGRSAPPEVGS